MYHKIKRGREREEGRERERKKRRGRMKGGREGGRGERREERKKGGGREATLTCTFRECDSALPALPVRSSSLS